MGNSRKSMTRIEKRKRLDALFDRGAYVRFGSDGQGRPIVNPDAEDDADFVVWVSPPSPYQREMAVREAQAARARVLIEARDNDGSNEWLHVRGFVSALNTDTLIEYVLELDDGEYLSQARRDVLVQKEWDDFNSLRDAMRQYEESEDQDAEEWKPLLERDERFGDQVSKRYTELRDDALAGYKLIPREKLVEKAVDARIEQAGSSAFLSAYEEWMLFYSLRDDEDHLALFFDSPRDVKSLPDEVQVALAGKLSSFISDQGEAKN